MFLELVEDQQRDQRFARRRRAARRRGGAGTPTATRLKRRCRAASTCRPPGWRGKIACLICSVGTGESGVVVDAHIDRAIAFRPQARNDARAQYRRLAQARLPNRIGQLLALHAPAEFGDLVFAAVEVAARLFAEGRQPQPRVLGIDREAQVVGQRRLSWRRSSAAGRQQIADALRELGWDFAARRLREVHGAKLVRHLRLTRVGVVDAHGQDEDRAFGDVARAVDGVTPLAAEEALEAALRRRRHDRNEERAAGDIALDLAVVVVAAFQPVEVEPRRDAGRVEAGLQLLHRGQVLARVADEHRVVGHLGATAAGSAAAPHAAE